LIGNEYFQEIVALSFRWSEDEQLGPLYDEFPELFKGEKPFIPDKALFTEIQNCPKLRFLDIDSSVFNDDDLFAIKDAQHLECIRLQNTGVSAKGLRLLHSLPCLKVLDLDGSQVGNSSINVLASLTNLRVLGIRGTQIDVQARNELVNAIPNCTVYWSDHDALENYMWDMRIEK
jgi:hypothetical protein